MIKYCISIDAFAVSRPEVTRKVSRLTSSAAATGSRFENAIVSNRSANFDFFNMNLCFLVIFRNIPKSSGGAFRSETVPLLKFSYQKFSLNFENLLSSTGFKVFFSEKFSLQNFSASSSRISVSQILF